jgi:hypothetical protein
MIFHGLIPVEHSRAFMVRRHGFAGAPEFISELGVAPGEAVT